MFPFFHSSVDWFPFPAIVNRATINMIVSLRQERKPLGICGGGIAGSYGHSIFSLHFPHPALDELRDDTPGGPAELSGGACA
jgi:hypothetical protein